MLGGIDLSSLLDGPMVEPEDDVVVIVKFGTGDGDGLIGVVGEDGEGTGSIEGETSDGAGINAVLIEDTLDGVADTSPDVVRGLFLRWRS